MKTSEDNVESLERPDMLRNRRRRRDLGGLDAGPRADKRRASIDVLVPTTMPYTTAGSEFVYGTFSVLAALKANRRRVYKLYHLQAMSDDESSGKRNTARKPTGALDHTRLQEQIHRLARKAGIQINEVTGPRWHSIFAKAADGRPHNGLILEASPVPKLPITSLMAVNQSSNPITVNVGWASQEEREVNRVFDATEHQASIPSIRPPHRFPFMLLLDRITDTGNLGAIARSAWFLGVDAILTLEHGTAPISSNSLKASAGALEYLPILHVKNEREFVRASRRNGWKFFAADAPETDGRIMRRIVTTRGGEALPVEGALLKHPCVLVLGNEDEGIRDFMRTLMDGIAAIPNSRPGLGDIDSLNVSVAAALLTQKFIDSAPAQPMLKNEETLFT